MRLLLAILLLTSAGCSTVPTPSSPPGYELDTTPDEQGEHYR